MKAIEKIILYPRLGLVILTFVAFIALGMPDGLLGVAWPSIRMDFSIPLDSLGVLLFMSTTGYLTSSFLSGRLIAKLGVGKVLVWSCISTGGALIGYTLAPEWWLIPVLGVFAGLGAGAIDSGLNTFVAAHFGEGLMQWLHASYGIGVTSGPIIMTFALTSLGDWRPGYRIVGGFQLVLALCFILTLPMWAQNNAPTQGDHPRVLTDYKTSLKLTLHQARVWLSMVLFFLYVGSEVSLGAWAFTFLTEARGVASQTAGLVTGSYWATFTLGRILAGLYTKRIGNTSLVMFSLVGALSGALLLLWNPASWTNPAAVALIGFAIAPVFPAMISGTSQRVGKKFAANTIGMQIAAGGLGGAAIPGLVGVLAQRVDLWIVPICFVVLFSLLLILNRIEFRFKTAD